MDSGAYKVKHIYLLGGGEIKLMYHFSNEWFPKSVPVLVLPSKENILNKSPFCLNLALPQGSINSKQ